MESRLQLLKKTKKFLHNTFSNRKAEWQRQYEFISAIAEANDIYFDANEFPKPKRHLKHGRIVWEQSKAAEYISEKIHEKMLHDEYVFKPWNAAWLPVRRKDLYERVPFCCVPIRDTAKLKAEEGKVWVFVFSSHTRQEQWIALEDYKYRAICKDCMFKWEHYGADCLNDENSSNLDDIVNVSSTEGTIERAFKCPKCGSLRIYKDAHWLIKQNI